MKLSDDEIIMFGAMMFAGGLNHAKGKDVTDLANMPREEFAKAKATATSEYPRFKKEIKKRRTN